MIVCSITFIKWLICELLLYCDVVLPVCAHLHFRLRNFSLGLMTFPFFFEKSYKKILRLFQMTIAAYLEQVWKNIMIRTDTHLPQYSTMSIDEQIDLFYIISKPDLIENPISWIFRYNDHQLWENKETVEICCWKWHQLFGGLWYHWLSS